MLAGSRVLVVEDNSLIADDLADEIKTADGKVIGPVASVAEGLRIAAQEAVAGAILDCQLTDRDVTPLALLLLERGIPFVIYSGTGAPIEVRHRFPAVVVYEKPAASKVVVAALAALIAPANVLPITARRFFFDVRLDGVLNADDDGLWLASIERAKIEAASALGEMVRDRLLGMAAGEAFRLSIEVRDQGGHHLHEASLVFASGGPKIIQ